MQARKVRLVLRPTKFVTSADDMDDDSGAQALSVNVVVWDNLVALAESAGWRSPGRQLKCRGMSRPTLASFLQHLREELEAVPTGRRARFSTATQLRGFFELPVNRKSAMKVLALLDQGGELTVEE